MSRDFQQSGQAQVSANLSSYRNLYPTRGEDPYWNSFQFNNGAGANNATHVTQLTTWATPISIPNILV
jgi:hypothetical protein